MYSRSSTRSQLVFLRITRASSTRWVSFSSFTSPNLRASDPWRDGTFWEAIRTWMARAAWSASSRELQRASTRSGLGSSSIERANALRATARRWRTAGTTFRAS